MEPSAQLGGSISLAITLGAIAVMGYSLWLVASLKRHIPGGIIGQRWNMLLWLVSLFAVGYLTTPFFGAIPEQVLRLIVAAIFFFGAVYVLVTVKLLYRVIHELAS